jgi:hypothetical protein
MNRKERRDVKELKSKLAFYKSELNNLAKPTIDLEGDMEIRQAQIRAWTVRRGNLNRKIYEMETAIGNARRKT